MMKTLMALNEAGRYAGHRKGVLLLLCVMCLTAGAIVRLLPQRHASPSRTLEIRGQPLRLSNRRTEDPSDGAYRVREVLRAWQKLHLPETPQWPELVHAVRFWERSDFNSSDTWSQERVLQLVFDSQVMEQHYPNSGFHQVTQYGLQLRTLEESLRGATTRPGDSHPDKTLAVIACLGIESSHPIRVRGRELTVADVVRNRIANFSLERELPWTVIALALYLPPTTEWTNKFGQVFDFNSVANALAASELGRGSCFGTHTLFALTVLLDVDERYRILTKDMRQQAVSKLVRVAEQLCLAQRPDGGWDSKWSEPERDVSRVTIYDPEAITSVIVTGHMLEWLALAPVELRVDEPLVKRALAFLTVAMLAESPAGIESHFSAYSHAANALKLWRPDTWKLYSQRPIASHVMAP